MWNFIPESKHIPYVATDDVKRFCRMEDDGINQIVFTLLPGLPVLPRSVALDAPPNQVNSAGFQADMWIRLSWRGRRISQREDAPGDPPTR